MIAVLFLNIMSTKRYSLRKSRQNLKKGQDVQYCRTCLSSQDLVPIFPNEHMQLKRTEDLKLVTGLEIKCNDDLSQMICTECIERMNIALQFRSESRKAEKALLELALGTKIKKKCDSEASVVKKPKIQKCNPYEVEIENFSYQDKNVPIVDYNFDSVSDNGADDWQNDEVHVKVENDDCDDFAEKSEDVEPKIRQSEVEPKEEADRTPRRPETILESLIKRPSTHPKLKVAEEPTDWKPADKCSFCVDGERGEVAGGGEARQAGGAAYTKKPLPKQPAKKRSTIPKATNYKCNICSKEYRMKASYASHLRFHTNFCVCEACGKRFRNNSQLQMHKRARHGLSRIHKCASCDYSSVTKESLTIHERTHTGEKPYICDYCGCAFHRRSNLVQHIGVHLPQKFQCDMCPKRLRSLKFLQVHKHNVHPRKRYGCSICSQLYTHPEDVRIHTRFVHGLPDDQQAPAINVQL